MNPVFFQFTLALQKIKGVGNIAFSNTCAFPVEARSQKGDLLRLCARRSLEVIEVLLVSKGRNNVFPLVKLYSRGAA